MYIPTTTLNQQLAAGIDGWVDDSANAWTFVSAASFSTTGDRTVVFSKGTRIKLTQSAVVAYFVVVSSSFGGGITTVTITGGTDYTLANAAISANYYSYADNPNGYPGWFNYTPTYTGFSSDPALSGGYIRFMVIGAACCMAHVPFTNGTSDATGFTITLPITALLTSVGEGGRGMNNSALLTTPVMVSISGGSGTATIQRDYSGATWTAAGNKNGQFTIWYSI